MADAQAAFLDAAFTALHLLERGELAERWQQGSVPDMAVLRALARQERGPVQALRVL